MPTCRSSSLQALTRLKPERTPIGSAIPATSAARATRCWDSGQLILQTFVPYPGQLSGTRYAKRRVMCSTPGVCASNCNSRWAFGRIGSGNSGVAWSPRLAFTWSPFAKGGTSISGGYAITHDAVTMAMLGLPGPDGLHHAVRRERPPAGPPAPSSFAIGNASLRLPRASNWTLDAEQRLTPRLSVTAKYLRRRGPMGSPSSIRWRRMRRPHCSRCPAGNPPGSTNSPTCAAIITIRSPYRCTRP